MNNINNCLTPKIEIHCDGSCTDQTGGIGIVISSDKTETLICKGAFYNTTNNRMEMSAFLYGIHYLQEFLKKNNINHNIDIQLYADSKYVVDGYNSWVNNWILNEWRGSNNQPVLNLDLWQEIYEIKKLYNYKVFWEKAHDVNKLNNKADLLAKLAANNNSFVFTYQTSSDL